MFNKNEIIKKIEELKKKKNSLKANIHANIGLTIGSLALNVIGGILPISSIVGVGFIIASSINYNKVSNKIKKLFEINVDLEKYKDQMEFLNKLSKLIDEHYKEAFEGQNFIKEEQICKQIKLNSPQQMDSKIINELKIQTEKIFKTQKDNHYNILVLGRTGVGKSTLINVVLDLKGENAEKKMQLSLKQGLIIMK